MSEQVATSQVEEVAPAAANVQPEQAVEAPVSADQKVPEVPKPVAGDEAVAKGSEEVVKPADEVADEKKPTSSEEDKVEPVAEKKSDSGDDKAVVEDKGVEKVAAPEEKPAESAAKEGPVVEATNGNSKSEDKVAGEEQKVDEPVVAEETNGVCKRKNENGGAEVVEDEKTPKKAKVIDEGDQAPVEETAA